MILWGVFVLLCFGCAEQQPSISSVGENWGIYKLDLQSKEVNLLYGAEREISGLSRDLAGKRLVFSQHVDGSEYENTEIYTLDLFTLEPTRLTQNENWDLYPVWSPDGSQIAFLSWRDATLDIYLMDADGNNQNLLYDSGFHDADLDWVGDKIAFTSQDRIWIMDKDGGNPSPLTDPPRAGEWGAANLPFGDYDPRISPDGTRIVFSRLIDDQSVHGNYDLFIGDENGSQIQNLTGTGYSQGLSSWSPNGEKLLYILSAKGEQGFYNLYEINRDGTENISITPAYFPANFLIHGARYSADGKEVYFIGQWWNEE
jgi:Tol biopolymer transport system component